MTFTEEKSESDRLSALAEFNILDTDAEEAYDDIAQLATHICGTPYAAISFVAKDRQWYKAKVGIDICETGREVSFCTFAIAQRGILEVPDATKDPRFADSPLVMCDPFYKFYAGIPLTTRDGHSIGTICVMDSLPRSLSHRARVALNSLARLTISQLLRRKSESLLAEIVSKPERADFQREKLLNSIPSILIAVDQLGCITSWTSPSHSVQTPWKALMRIVASPSRQRAFENSRSVASLLRLLRCKVGYCWPKTIR